MQQYDVTQVYQRNCVMKCYIREDELRACLHTRWYSLRGHWVEVTPDASMTTRVILEADSREALDHDVETLQQIESDLERAEQLTWMAQKMGYEKDHAKRLVALENEITELRNKVAVWEGMFHGHLAQYHDGGEPGVDRELFGK